MQEREGVEIGCERARETSAAEEVLQRFKDREGPRAYKVILELDEMKQCLSTTDTQRESMFFLFISSPNGEFNLQCNRQAPPEIAYPNEWRHNLHIAWREAIPRGWAKSVCNAVYKNNGLFSCLIWKGIALVQRLP